MIEKTLFSEVTIDGKEQLLIERYIDFKHLKKSWSEKAILKGLDFQIKPAEKFSRTQDSVISTIVRNINNNYLNVTKPDKKLGIIKVEVKAEDEGFAKSFTEQIVKNVNQFYVETKTKKALDNVRILQRKSDSVRAVMNGAIYSAVAIADATPNLNPTRQVNRVAPMQKYQFSAESNRLILGELVKNLEMSKMVLRQQTPLIQVVDSPVFPLEVEKLGRIRGVVIGLIVGVFTSFLFLTVARFIVRTLRV